MISWLDASTHPCCNHPLRQLFNRLLRTPADKVSWLACRPCPDRKQYRHLHGPAPVLHNTSRRPSNPVDPARQLHKMCRSETCTDHGQESTGRAKNRLDEWGPEPVSLAKFRTLTAMSNARERGPALSVAGVPSRYSWSKLWRRGEGGTHRTMPPKKPTEAHRHGRPLVVTARLGSKASSAAGGEARSPECSPSHHVPTTWHNQDTSIMLLLHPNRPPWSHLSVFLPS